MPANRKFEVKAISRVEGEGALYVQLDGDEITRVELNIYEPPRFFESFLRGREIREVPDITARICGICPVAYQMTSCQALESALGLTIPQPIQHLRRLLYCGEWIESHSLHIYLLHAPDFLGYESGVSMARDHRDIVERGLRMKRIGNEILEVLGGRAIHPINVAVGGFHRSPSVASLKALLPELQWGLQAAIDTLHWVAAFDCPDLQVDYESVALRHPQEYPMNTGQIATTSLGEFAVNEYESHFQERHVAHSNALHSVMLPQEREYLVGPLARWNLCFEQLPPLTKAEAERARIPWPCRNNFQSIAIRAVEVIAAFEEAIRIVTGYATVPTPSRIDFRPVAGEGFHATEAPRGLIYHRYRIGDDGLIAEAKIVPPTSQNQGQIESDLRRLIPQVLSHDDQEATRVCEHMIRNYDPCISCATHFLRLEINRT